jgi:hypothetical protein
VGGVAVDEVVDEMVDEMAGGTAGVEDAEGGEIGGADEVVAASVVTGLGVEGVDVVRADVVSVGAADSSVLHDATISAITSPIDATVRFTIRS